MRFLVDSIKAAEEAATTANKSDEEQQWWKGGVEVLVVDDGSTDDTVHVAESLASSWEKEGKPVGVEIRVVKLQRNRGKGGAVRHVETQPSPSEARISLLRAERESVSLPPRERRRPLESLVLLAPTEATAVRLSTAFRATESIHLRPTVMAQDAWCLTLPIYERAGVLFSRGRRILFADADGASNFSDLALLQRAMDKLLKSPSANGHAIVVGSRAHMVNSDAVVKDGKQRSFLRNLLMRAFHIFLRTLGVRGVKDTQCGFKLFTRPTARTLFPTLHLHRWSFDVELLLLAQILRLPIAEVSIRWHEVPGSKINVGWDGLGMARDLVVLRGNLALGRWVVPKVVMDGDKAGERDGKPNQS
ncbi:hypothetical protein QFC24_001673 [Naganishia onofrii]|uniref:Uncharacterized protein n=1 Tax=Naganishia onofrii TaxID=1851511 RepID=A0ACC2XTE7_9TREE|nr:hypothetical protein QFC24_001673 [Naganishia onofrii]